AAHAPDVLGEERAALDAVVDGVVFDPVLRPGAHRGAPLGGDGAAGVAADLAGDAVRPFGLVVVRRADEEGVVVRADQGAVQGAVTADGGDAGGVAGAVQDHVALGHAGVAGQPGGVERLQRRGAVGVR